MGSSVVEWVSKDSELEAHSREPQDLPWKLVKAPRCLTWRFRCFAQDLCTASSLSWSLGYSLEAGTACKVTGLLASVSRVPQLPPS